MQYLTSSWLWISIGVGSVIVSLFTPTIELLCIGLSAILTGGIFVIIPELGSKSLRFILEVIFFCFLSITQIFLFRKKAKYKLTNDIEKEFIIPPGEKVRVIKEILPGYEGSIRYRGTEWKAISNEKIDKDTIVEVIGIVGNKVKVKKMNFY